MSRYEDLLRALASGDLESAKAFWRSKAWSPAERARAERLLRTSTKLSIEVLS